MYRVLPVKLNKQCNKCSISLTIDNVVKNGKSGFLNRCKPCKNIIKQNLLRSGPDQVKKREERLLKKGKCRKCFVLLNHENSAFWKNNISIRNICKKCHNVECLGYVRINPRRIALAKKWRIEHRNKSGKNSDHICPYCQIIFYRTDRRSDFCSDKCRFMSMIDKQDNGCWLWTGQITKSGYGLFKVKGKSRTKSSHRYSYELFNGPMQNNLSVCHECDIRNCVNPSHLWLGTNKDNMMDMVDKERRSCKLKSMDVFNILKMNDAGYSQASMAKIFKVSASHICKIIKKYSSFK